MTVRYGVAAFVAAFMLFAGIALSGAGHGWVSGGFGCFALAPVACFAWFNALSPRPSRRAAVAALALGLVACVAVAIATAEEGLRYLFDYLRVAGIAGLLIGGIAYFNWLFAPVVAVFRARRVSLHSL